MNKIVHAIFGENIFLDGIKRLNRLYSQITVPNVPGLEKVPKNRSSLLRTADDYEWQYGFMGNISDVRGKLFPILVLFPEVNYRSDGRGRDLQRSIAIFGKSKNHKDYNSFMNNFIHSMRIQELLFCRLRRVIRTGTEFYDEKDRLWCDLCRRSQPDKAFYVSRCGAIHKSCLVKMMCDE